MAIRHPKKQKVSDMFFNDPERGQQVIERIHQAKEEHRTHPKRKKTSEQEIQIIPDGPGG